METAPFDISLYKQALIVLGAAGVVIPLFHRLHVSPVLGFMLVGIVVGPFGLASLTPHLPWLSAITIGAPASIEPIAHLGVVLLLFMIGLELSFERLWVMRRLVFGLGLLQVVLCAALLAGVTILLGYDRIGAGVIGLALAMSSTAVVIQVLSEEKRLNTVTGRTSFAILLFQDLAVVPLLLVLGIFAPANQVRNMAGFGLAVGQALLTVTAIAALGRLVLRPLFRSVARTHSAELFVAACLLVVIAVGLATAAAGLSMALGALIGGLLLAGTEYRRQVEVTIDPFKGLAVGVFLISVGMSLDIRTLGAQPFLVLATVGCVVLLKLMVVTGLARAFGLNWAHSLHTGLLLGLGGERRSFVGAAHRPGIAVRHRPDNGDHSAAVSAGWETGASPCAQDAGGSEHSGASRFRRATPGDRRRVRPCRPDRRGNAGSAQGALCCDRPRCRPSGAPAEAGSACVFR